ncbi:MAG: AAA family ATPase [Planctomycetia bacterium]|nr:AAA family ATPase [Planctomycetia bacterium]
MTNPRSMLVTSGKGGVGKTHFSVSASIEWARMGQRVILVDVDYGTPNSHIYLDIKKRENTLKEVIQGRCSLEKALCEIPHDYWRGESDTEGGSLHFLPGSINRFVMEDFSAKEQLKLQDSLNQLKNEADIFVFDSGAGIDENLLQFSAFCEEMILITDVEPASRADALRLWFSVQELDSPPICWLVPNSVKDELEGNALFVHLKEKMEDAPLRWAGAIRNDERLMEATRAGEIFNLREPGSKASIDLREIAKTMLEESPFGDGSGAGFGEIINEALDF